MRSQVEQRSKSEDQVYVEKKWQELQRARGHRGQILRLVAVTDEIDERRSAVSSACQAPMIAPAPVAQCERRQVKQIPGQNLVERLWLGQEQVIAFFDDLALLFDNNQAERNLRMLKVHQKGLRLLTALASLCAGQLLAPVFA
jgi:hypothetical protein